jgi:Tol biopolymer transport system component
MVGRPAWSPDSSGIAFLDSRARLLQNIDVASGITMPLAALTEGLDGAIRAPIVTRGGPAWSPDGTRIAFICWDGFGDELCIVDAKGTARQQVTTLGGAEERAGDAARSSVTSMAWSPHGAALAVAVQSEGQGGSSGIFRVELDARSGKRLTKLTANAPIVWEAATDDLIFSAQVEGRSDVYRLAAAGGKPEPITSALVDGAREPDVADNGAIAVVSGDRIGIMQPANTDATFLEEAGLACAAPALGADANQLAFLALPRPIENYP